MLSAPILDGKTVLEERIGQRREEARTMTWTGRKDILGEMEGGYGERPLCKLLGF